MRHFSFQTGLYSLNLFLVWPCNYPFQLKDRKIIHLKKNTLPLLHLAPAPAWQSLSLLNATSFKTSRIIWPPTSRRTSQGRLPTPGPHFLDLSSPKAWSPSFHPRRLLFDARRRVILAPPRPVIWSRPPPPLDRLATFSQGDPLSAASSHFAASFLNLWEFRDTCSVYLFFCNDSAALVGVVQLRNTNRKKGDELFDRLVRVGVSAKRKRQKETSWSASPNTVETQHEGSLNAGFEWEAHNPFSPHWPRLIPSIQPHHYGN